MIIHNKIGDSIEFSINENLINIISINPISANLTGFKSLFDSLTSKYER
jgi:hypothetical protein